MRKNFITKFVSQSTITNILEKKIENVRELEINFSKNSKL